MSDAEQILTLRQDLEIAVGALHDKKTALAEMIAEQALKKQELTDLKEQYASKKENPGDGDQKIIKTILKGMRAAIKVGNETVKAIAAQVKTLKAEVKEWTGVVREIKRKMRAEEAARKEAEKILKKTAKATA